VSETVNTSIMADRISDEIFKWFFWKRRPSKNRDWDCVIPGHGCKTHPSDVVFHYHHPYENCEKYINVDLKSYAKDSINNQSIQKAVESMAKAVHCANISDNWHENFSVHHDYEVDGLLFVYNHDGKYDKRFRSHFKGIESKVVPLEPAQNIYVFGPQTISLMVDIVTDIKNYIVEKVIDGRESYSFYYPDLFRHKLTGGEWDCPALPEHITSPWLIVKYKLGVNDGKGYIVYYNSPGETTEEFMYFLDYLSHIQLLLSDAPIDVRFTRPTTYSASNFEKASKQYVASWGFDDFREKKIARINFGQINRFSTDYSDLEIGMNV